MPWQKPAPTTSAQRTCPVPHMLYAVRSATSDAESAQCLPKVNASPDLTVVNRLYHAVPCNATPQAISSLEASQKDTEQLQLQHLEDTGKVTVTHQRKGDCTQQETPSSLETALTEFFSTEAWQLGEHQHRHSTPSRTSPDVSLPRPAMEMASSSSSSSSTVNKGKVSFAKSSTYGTSSGTGTGTGTSSGSGGFGARSSSASSKLVLPTWQPGRMDAPVPKKL